MRSPHAVAGFVAFDFPAAIVAREPHVMIGDHRIIQRDSAVSRSADPVVECRQRKPLAITLRREFNHRCRIEFGDDERQGLLVVARFLGRRRGVFESKSPMTDHQFLSGLDRTLVHADECAVRAA